MNYRLLAIEVGQLLKYSTSLREIDRFAGAIFDFPCKNHPNEAITSQRAQLIYDWILTLASHQSDQTKKTTQLLQFCHSLAPDEDHRAKIDTVLQNAGFIAGTTSATNNNSNNDYATVRIQIEQLLNIFDEQLLASDPQRRGYILQELLTKAFPLHGIPVIKSFTRNEGGEQIDGAFRLDGWHYIVECRWRKEFANIRELDGLKGQVSRSGRQTMGVFLSINGWSKNVPDLLQQNPDKSIILMDGYDFRCILDGSIDLKELIRAKIEKLNIESLPFYSAIDYRSEHQAG